MPFISYCTAFPGQPHVLSLLVLNCLYSHSDVPQVVGNHSNCMEILGYRKVAVARMDMTSKQVLMAAVWHCHHQLRRLVFFYRPGTEETVDRFHDIFFNLFII